MYNIDGSFSQPENDPEELFSGCKGKSIDELYDSDRAFNFEANKPRTLKLDKYELPHLNYPSYINCAKETGELDLFMFES